MNIKSTACSALTVMASVFCMTVALRPTLVSGASMMPTLHDKDVLITSPLAKEFFQPTRGDIVTICLAASPLCGFIFSGAAQYVKRIVAVSGDTVRYSACNIVVTTAAGQKIRDTERTMPCRDWGDLKQVVIPDGMYFVAGDNRGNSLIREFSGQSANPKSIPRAQIRFPWSP